MNRGHARHEEFDEVPRRELRIGLEDHEDLTSSSPSSRGMPMAAAFWNTDSPVLPASAESAAMHRLHQELERRDLGNGYGSRPAKLACSSRP